MEIGSMDVLIIGGGPVGLVTAYALQKMNVSTCIIGESIRYKHPFEMTLADWSVRAS